MTWVKLDDDFPDRPAVAALGDGAFRLHVSGLAYVNRLLTDGLVPLTQAARLTPNYDPAHLAELLAGGVWAVADGGYRVVDSMDDQPASDKVLATRKANRERQRRWSEAQNKKRRAAGGKANMPNAVNNALANGVRPNAPNGRPDPSPPYGGRVSTAANGGAVVETDDHDRPVSPRIYTGTESMGELIQRLSPVPLADGIGPTVPPAEDLTAAALDIFGDMLAHPEADA